MIRYLLLFVILVCITPCLAQKTSIGVVDTDYLLSLVPGYPSWGDTKNKAQLAAQKKAMSIQTRYERKLTEKDSLVSTGITWERQQALTDELIQIETEYYDFVKHVGDSARLNDSIALAGFNREWQRAAFTAAEREKCFGIAKQNEVAGQQTPKGIVYVDITQAVAAELKSPTPSTGKKRVGVCNYDSLLMLLPGYHQVIDSCAAYKKSVSVQLAAMDKEIAKKERERDSLSSQSSALINALRERQIEELYRHRAMFVEVAAQEEESFESRLLVPVRQQLDAAIAIATPENNCTLTYDRAVAHQTWNESEAEFIDLNGAIAPKLR